MMWDTIWGQKYMYNRGSVVDKKFYLEFEKDNPSHPKSDSANIYLTRKLKK